MKDTGSGFALRAPRNDELRKRSARSTLRFPSRRGGDRLPSYVYLLSSRPYGTLHLGVTSNLGQRIVQHKRKAFRGFSAKYGVDRLVWMEEYDLVVDAIAREKMLKKWRRDWKIALIEAMNPEWEDLFERLNW